MSFSRKNAKKWFLYNLFIFTLVIKPSSAAQISIQTDVKAIGSADIYNLVSSSPTYRPQLTMGIRVAPLEQFAFDFSGSFLFQTEVEENESEDTDPRPSLFSMGLEIAAIAQLSSAGKAHLGIRPAFELLFVRQSQLMYSIEGNTKYAYYTSVVPTIFLGLEPFYSISNHFGLYTRIGLGFTFYPRSKYVDTTDSRYDFSRNEFPMEQRDDFRFGMLIDGVDVGVRYTF